MRYARLTNYAPIRPCNSYFWDILHVSKKKFGIFASPTIKRPLLTTISLLVTSETSCMSYWGRRRPQIYRVVSTFCKFEISTDTLYK